MELSNEFEVGIPAAEAWSVLTDVERIAPCLPGAQLQEIEGEEYRGIVKVKVGPITAQYKGKATFVELDEDGQRAVLTATGRDTRGQGNANATITAELTDRGEETHVSVVTDLMLTGKVAQFGRGVLADVSANLMEQFVDNLHASLRDEASAQESEPAAAAADAADVDKASDDASTAGPAGNGDSPPGDAAEAAEGGEIVEGGESGEGGDSDTPGIRQVDHPEPEHIDLVGHAGWRGGCRRTVP